MYIITSVSTVHRVPVLMHEWGNRIQRHPAISLLSFVSIPKENRSFAPYPSIEMNSSYDRWNSILDTAKHGYNLELAKKDCFIMRHCVEQTNASWCMRTLDDTYVNMKGFEEFLIWLSRKENPRSNVMAFGHCINMWNSYFILQGGTGWIFSRRTAELMIEEEDNWISTINGWEDHHLTQFLTKVRLSSQDVSCPYFSGHFLETKEAVMTWSWNDSLIYKTCPDKVPDHKFCVNTFRPFHEVAFTHSLGYKMTQTQWREWFARMPQNAMIYYHDLDLHICKPNE